MKSPSVKSNNMDMNAMYWLVKVVELGSMSRAAKQGGCAVSTVSAKIAQLERQLNVRLLERSTRKLHLTEAGALFMQHAHVAVEAASAASAAVESQQRRPSGLLRVTASPELITPNFATKLKVWLALHPDLNLQIVVTNERKDIVQDGIDLAIRMGSLENSQLVAKKICDTALCVVASEAFIKQHKAILTPKDLLQVPCIAIASNRGEIHPWVFTQAEQSVELVPSGQIIVNSVAAGMILAQQHHGVCLISQAMRMSSTVTLQPVLANWQLPLIPVWAIFPNRKYLSAKVRVFIQFIQDVLAG